MGLTLASSLYKGAPTLGSTALYETKYKASLTSFLTSTQLFYLAFVYVMSTYFKTPMSVRFYT